MLLGISLLGLCAFVGIRYIRNRLAEKQAVPIIVPDTRDFGRQIRNRQ